MEKEKNSQKRNFIILLLIFLLLIAIITVLLALLLMPKEQESASSKQFSYEANVVVDDAESLQDAVNQLIEKAKEGQMALEMKTEAHSEDGKTFTCFLANSLSNNYDMFMVFYRDDTQEEIYRTGLIPVGARIEEFTLEDALAPGTYDITVVYNQVESDRETIHAQVNVGLILVVK